jgi:23S rRNA pseudouridine2605 synthase
MTDSASHEPTRLNKQLALLLGISRREADNFIKSGRVKINGAKATLGDRVVESDIIEVDNRRLDVKPDFIYIMLNKPVGYVSSRRQQGDTPTLYKLLPLPYQTLKTVGRLDKDSSGLIILTNDGDFTQRMTHPSYTKVKVYEVELERELEPLHQQMISDYGVDLPDGKSQLQLMRLSDSSRKSWQVTMHEGRNRQIRRTFAALGYTVISLHRTNFGNYALGDMKPGDFKIVDMR